MKRESTDKTNRSVICSAAKKFDGSPVWIFSNDGHLFLSADGVKQAAISKAHIRT